MDNLYKSYVSLSTEELLELRDKFLEKRSKGIFVDFKQEAVLQQVLLDERCIRPVIGCLASLEARLIAKEIDWIIALFIFIACKALIDNLIISIAWFSLIPLISCGAYVLLADGLHGGQSPGKRLMGIAAVHVTTRKPCGFVQSFKRNVLLYLLIALSIDRPISIVDWLSILGCKHRRLGDILASTIVIKVKNIGKWPNYSIKVLLIFSLLCWLFLFCLMGLKLFGILF